MDFVVGLSKVRKGYNAFVGHYWLTDQVGALHYSKRHCEYIPARSDICQRDS